MKKVNSENINQYITDKFGNGATVMGKLDSGKIVIKTSSGVTTTISESQVSNHTVTAGERTKQANLSALSAKAKANVAAERQANRQAKADAQAAISAGVAAKRAQRDNEHDAFTKYGV